MVLIFHNNQKKNANICLKTYFTLKLLATSNDSTRSGQVLVYNVVCFFDKVLLLS